MFITTEPRVFDSLAEAEAAAEALRRRNEDMCTYKTYETLSGDYVVAAIDEDGSFFAFLAI